MGKLKCFVIDPGYRFEARLVHGFSLPTDFQKGSLGK